MKKWLVAVLLVAMTACSSKGYKFTEGPARLKCQADTLFAYVGKTWTVTCLIEGNMAMYQNVELGIQYWPEKFEEFPARSRIASERVFYVGFQPDVEYYLLMRGKLPLDPRDYNTPAPQQGYDSLEPIEGIENAFDGKFKFYIQLWDIDEGKILDAAEVPGHLNCPQCVV